MTMGDFSGQAAWYDLSRPSYPSEMTDALIAEAGVDPGDSVVELGAGTGIFTRLLADHGLQVTAVEPNRKMRKQAPDLTDVQWIDGTFEETPLKNASQRWAVAAQAFHWANPERSLPEVRRILVPHGVFSILWNSRDPRECEILDWTERAILRHVPEFAEAYRDRGWPEILESTGDFECISERVVHHRVSMTKKRFLDLWKSHNRLNTIAGPERFASFLSELADYLEEEGIDRLDVPYRCEAWSARRTD